MTDRDDRVSQNRHATTKRTCEHCGEAFSPNAETFLTVTGPSTAEFRCPECDRVTTGHPPVDRPDVLPYSTVDVPVTVDLPEEVLEECRRAYEHNAGCGSPDFEDYLWDVCNFKPTFTVDGDPIEETLSEEVR